MSDPAAPSSPPPSRDDGDWTCPACGQVFARPHQRHACVRVSLDEFFAGRPAHRALFDAVRAVLEGFGPVDVGVTRSQVSFRHRTRFVWLWEPGRWLRLPEDDLVLTLDLRRREPSRRFKEAVEVAPGRWTHHLVLRSAGQLDAELIGWLREAWEEAGPSP